MSSDELPVVSGGSALPCAVASRHTTRLLVVAVAALVLALGALLTLPGRGQPTVVARATLAGESTGTSRAGSVTPAAEPTASPSRPAAAAPGRPAATTAGRAPVRRVPAAGTKVAGAKAATKGAASSGDQGHSQAHSPSQGRQAQQGRSPHRVRDRAGSRCRPDGRCRPWSGPQRQPSPSRPGPSGWPSGWASNWLQYLPSSWWFPRG